MVKLKEAGGKAPPAELSVNAPEHVGHETDDHRVARSAVPDEPSVEGVGVRTALLLELPPRDRERELVHVGAERHLVAAASVGLADRAAEAVEVEQALGEFAPRLDSERVARRVQPIEEGEHLVEALASLVGQLEVAEHGEASFGSHAHLGTRIARAASFSISSAQSAPKPSAS